MTFLTPGGTEAATQGQSSVRKVHLRQHLQGWSDNPQSVLFRVNRDVSEAIVKEHMNGKYLKYVTIKMMSKAKAVLNRF